MAVGRNVVTNDRVVVHVENRRFHVGVLGVPNLHRVALSLETEQLSAPPISADLIGQLADARVEGVLLWDPLLGPDEAAAASDDEGRAVSSAAAARAFVEAMIPTYDQFAARGITTIMHAELGPAAWMFRSASAEICQELTFEDPKERQKARWVLRRLVAFVGVTRKSAIERVLPRQLRSAQPWRDEALVLFGAERPKLRVTS